MSVFLIPQHQSITKESKTNISVEFARKLKDHNVSSAEKSGVSVKGANAIAKFFGLGTWSQYTIVDESNIAKVSDSNIPHPVVRTLS